MNYKKVIIIAVISSIIIAACKTETRNYLQFVDPLVGTAKTSVDNKNFISGSTENRGQTIPAVTAPFGMTQWTPQTQSTEQKCAAPFYFGSMAIQGFRATHWLDGSCTQDYGSFTVCPTNQINFSRLSPEQRNTFYMLNTDTLSPAYLAAMFPEPGIMAELTATKRCGFFRFSWVDARNPTVIVDINNDHGEGFIKVDSVNQEVVGYNPVNRIYSGIGKSAGIAGYFVIKFSHDFSAYGTYCGTDYSKGKSVQKNGNDMGAYVSFDLKNDAVILTKIGTSFTSIDNARENLKAEIRNWDFNKTKINLENEWNEMLGRIDIEGGSDEDYTRFYTAMYHSLFHPRLYSDVNGAYPGFADDTLIHKADGFDYYDDFSNWDIYRAQMPLLSIIAPKDYNDMVKSLIVKAEQGGWLPIFPMWNSYTSAMIGDHGSGIIADAAMKGFNFDIEKAYFYMRKNSFETPRNFEDYIDGKGRRALKSYLQFGYIPLEDEVLEAFHKREQVSRTLEYAYDDWAVAQVAKKLEKEEDYKKLTARSYNYINVFDEDKGWVCGRFADGTFTDKFNENEREYYITEGTPKQYTFYVPHDIPGLIEMLGGENQFESKLNTLFDEHGYWHGNEPGQQIPYLFNFTGNWGKTQSIVKNILLSEYGTGSGSLSGNDDAGQMSAWYVFGAMGFYPVCPGNNEYQLSSPIFHKIILNLDKKYYPGGKFTISAESGKNYSVYTKVMYNGKTIKPVIFHEYLQKGGELQFTGAE